MNATSPFIRRKGDRPDATILLDYMLQRLTSVYRSMVVYPERMEQNLMLTKGLYHSEAMLSAS